jgi:hypothetical protein
VEIDIRRTDEDFRPTISAGLNAGNYADQYEVLQSLAIPVLLLGGSQDVSLLPVLFCQTIDNMPLISCVGSIIYSNLSILPRSWGHKRKQLDFLLLDLEVVLVIPQVLKIPIGLSVKSLHSL